MSDIDTQKSEARKRAFAARKQAKAQDLDAAAQAHLSAALADHASDHLQAPLAGYMPIRTEVDPLAVMAAHRGAVCVPVIQGKGQALVFHRWTPDCALIAGPFGALVPAQGVAVTPRVVIVPLVGFDARGYRLGYGGGFYDRTLAGLRAAGPLLALGYAFDAQELSEVPIDRHDQRLDGIVTETGLRWFG